MKMLNIYTLIMLLSSFLAAISQILLKLSAKKNHKNWIMEYINPFVISGYLLLLLTMIMNIYAYSGIDYKFGPILTTTSYIVVVILSIYILKEKLNKNKIIGISLILIGIVIFNIKI